VAHVGGGFLGEVSDGLFREWPGGYSAGIFRRVFAGNGLEVIRWELSGGFSPGMAWMVFAGKCSGGSVGKGSGGLHWERLGVSPSGKARGAPSEKARGVSVGKGSGRLRRGVAGGLQAGLREVTEGSLAGRGRWAGGEGC
jgi:hypothetical protein